MGGLLAALLWAPAGLATRELLRDDARLVLERHCGECHIGTLPTALPAALAVYDLARLEWAATLTDAQLTGLAGRLAEGSAFFDPFDARNAGQRPPPAPTADEQAVVRTYVAAERAARTP
ncbi:MAG: hypothetical protein H6706_17705 [Myxococcales bacterium]|nr:hypothetical protein [Myxococcales bacterium]